jgi:site-specific recombinase XerD
MQLAEAVDLYLKSISIHMAAGSVKAYRSRLRFVVEMIGDADIASLKRKDLEQIVGIYRQGRRNATVRLLVVVLRNLFDWCVDEEILEHSPATRLKAPSRGLRLPRSLSSSTAIKLTTVCHDALASTHWRDKRNGALVLTLRYAGLRRAEARALTWGDIDFHDRMLTVLGKGNKERRIPAHHEVLFALRKFGVRKRGVIFCREDGNYLSLTAINQVVFDEWLCPQIGEHISPHQLRHTFATELVEKGASIDEVAALLGHESVSTTQIYVVCSPERLRSALDRL